MAFFSVVIPTFNRANLIVPAIKSVKTQSFADYEIIIVDDGSTDNTQDVVADMRIPELRYVRTENLERGHARNTGLHLATGDFVVFLDSDDLFEKDHLQVLFDAIKANPACNFFASKYRFLTSTGAIKPSGIQNLRQGFYSYIDLLKGNFLACNFCVRHINSKIKKFEEERRFSIMEDWMFLVENLRYERLYLVNEFTVLLRDHQDRSMNSNNQRIIERRTIATQWIEEHVTLSREELKVMWAYSFYFCAIHAYLDHKKVQAIRFVLDAIKLNGLTFSFLLLFSKILIGKRIIQLLRNEA
jgi:glycosyltransferase involved in cell wall biosynthesis